MTKPQHVSFEKGLERLAEHDLQEIEAGRGLTEFVIDRPADKPKS